MLPGHPSLSAGGAGRRNNVAAQKKDVIVEDGAVYILRAGTKVYLKTADVCAGTGKSNQWIGQLVNQGTLNKVRTPHGVLFDAKETFLAYNRMLEERGASPEEVEEDRQHEKGRRAAELTLKASKAKMAQLELRELQGKMHRSEDVQEFWDDMGFAIRGILLALPGRVAVDMAQATGADPAVCADLIRAECIKGLEELKLHRYDPAKYEEKVRGRMNWDDLAADLEDDS